MTPEQTFQVVLHDREQLPGSLLPPDVTTAIVDNARHAYMAAYQQQPDRYRARLIRIAALALAALETVPSNP